MPEKHCSVQLTLGTLHINMWKHEALHHDYLQSWPQHVNNQMKTRMATVPHVRPASATAEAQAVMLICFHIDQFANAKQTISIYLVSRRSVLVTVSVWVHAIAKVE